VVQQLTDLTLYYLVLVLLLKPQQEVVKVEIIPQLVTLVVQEVVGHGLPQLAVLELLAKEITEELDQLLCLAELQVVGVVDLEL
jgi:hypothetical protein